MAIFLTELWDEAVSGGEQARTKRGLTSDKMGDEKGEVSLR